MLCNNAGVVAYTLQNGRPPIEVADHIFRAIRDIRFYILPFPGVKRGVQARMESIIR